MIDWHLLTSSGRELLPLVEAPSNRDFMEALALDLKEAGYEVELRWHSDGATPIAG
jgi:hypothetical protein